MMVEVRGQLILGKAPTGSKLDKKCSTYHLIPTDHRHNAQRLDPDTPRIERRASITSVVPKDHIRMDIRIQICDLVVRRRLDFGLPGRFALGVGRGATAAVDGIGKVSVAVNVHVCELRGGTVEVDGVLAGVGEGFAAVGPFYWVICEDLKDGGEVRKEGKRI